MKADDKAPNGIKVDDEAANGMWVESRVKVSSKC